VLAFGSCGEEAVTPPAQAPRVEFKNLKNKDDVLHNLELAYNQCHMSEYDKLLDDSFVFIFSRADFLSGETPQQWDRVTEISSATLMLDPPLNDTHRIIKLSLKLDYDADGWVQDPPSPDHPDESWYKKTAGYDLFIETADGWEDRAHNLEAEFTIRWAGTPEDGHWRIVLWRDAV
jgi:hypothetical protein